MLTKLDLWILKIEGRLYTITYTIADWVWDIKPLQFASWWFRHTRFLNKIRVRQMRKAILVWSNE